MDLEQIIAKLSARGHRITRQRRLVLEVILADPCLQSAEGIYGKCRELDDSISYPTIYRTLDMLVEAGVVRKLHFNQGKSWYELVENNLHHHHLVCSECGAKVPISACPLELLKEDLQRAQFRVLDHQFEILGICKDCQSD
ncbi:MAG: Fur family transcriptional regulator [Eubacteriales bacterium]|nr:Fur family transcriptional regulator [Eubacteriales bacterium]MDD3072905.1 Fur family transcriptional regulator [Eubacteriales bacterium]MDD4079367.1 Fur family transcriptional regulator [Eubacteriales bacterium]MDD4769288.1 Fur family transcriptional regulator [Eubacteriales bacterium]